MQYVKLAVDRHDRAQSGTMHLGSVAVGRWRHM